MGRRRLLPNINNLLLQLHLPHRSGSSSNSNSSSSNGKVVNIRKQETEAPASTSTSSQKTLCSSSSLSACEHEASMDCNDHDDGHNHNPVPVPVPHQHHHVSFGHCEIRTYTQVLGDHPCCSEGCPIQLGWSYTSEESITVDDYAHAQLQLQLQAQLQEAQHNSNTNTNTCSRNSSLYELRLTPEERRSILILSKQQCFLNASHCHSNSHSSEGSSSGSSSSSGSDNDDQSDCDSTHTESSAIVGSAMPQEDPCCGGDQNSDPLQQQQQQQQQHSQQQQQQHSQHERELIRECRRLNRCGGWNVNVKASRKRNKRNQQAFFGAPMAVAMQLPTTTPTSLTTPIPPTISAMTI